DVYVGHVAAYDNPGDPNDTANPSGNGIALGRVNGGVIERSVAHDNGRLCRAGRGPAGLWTYDSTNVTIQRNESYNNRTGGAVDGNGFNLDQNVSDSVLQYNYTHGNDGSGYLMYSSFANGAHNRDTIRYNISQGDGRKNSFAGIRIGGYV